MIEAVKEIDINTAYSNNINIRRIMKTSKCSPLCRYFATSFHEDAMRTDFGACRTE